MRLTNFINKISICLCIRFTVYKKFYKSCLRGKSKLDQTSQGDQALWDVLKARFRFLCQVHSNKQRQIQSSLCFYRVPYLFGNKTGFPLSRMSTNNQISPMQFCCNSSFTLPEQSRRSRSVLKTDLDFWDCFGRKKTLSYKRRNTVTTDAENVCFTLMFPCAYSGFQSGGKGWFKGHFMVTCNML